MSIYVLYGSELVWNGCFERLLNGTVHATMRDRSDSRARVGLSATVVKAKYVDLGSVPKKNEDEGKDGKKDIACVWTGFDR
jgi:hypothetical protein